jgi:osmotically-inducible protein OsmY
MDSRNKNSRSGNRFRDSDNEYNRRDNRNNQDYNDNNSSMYGGRYDGNKDQNWQRENTSSWNNSNDYEGRNNDDNNWRNSSNNRYSGGNDRNWNENNKDNNGEQSGFGERSNDRWFNTSRFGNERNDRNSGNSDDRNWWDKTTDEVSSWFGDDDAERRRRMDKKEEGKHKGRGPKGYKRSDERIREDINDRLSDDHYVDASDIEVSVSEGEVTLTGTIDSKQAKRRAEDIADTISGVSNVLNQLRLKPADGSTFRSGASGFGTTDRTGNDSFR